MTQDEVLKKLNGEAKLRLGVSPIHGVGVFALRDITQGETLYSDQLPGLYHIPPGSLSKLFPEVKQEIVDHWPRVLQGTKFIYPFTPMQAYMNHSDDPNVDAFNDIALRDIKAGEELTEDYRNIVGWEKAFPWLSTPKKTKTKV